MKIDFDKKCNDMLVILVGDPSSPLDNFLKKTIPYKVLVERIKAQPSDLIEDFDMSKQGLLEPGYIE